ncbi:MAG: class I SAM-dependent methyltransferase [Acidobacteriota bacterium]
MPKTRHFVLLPLLGAVLSISAACASGGRPDASDAIYIDGPASRDGIGKTYLGREIAKTMTWHGISWLERPERAAREQPDRVIAALDLKPADVVADLGAGSGYFSFRIARQVPDGKVLAVDIQPEMLQAIEQRREETGLGHVEPVLGAIDDPNLPSSSVDWVLMVDAYHEFSHPHEMMVAIVAALKPGGRVALVEYRGEDPSVPIKELHKMTEAQVQREMRFVGLEHVETVDFLPDQHLLIFRKPLADG